MLQLSGDFFWKMARAAVAEGADRDSVVSAMVVAIMRLEDPKTTDGEAPPVAASAAPATIVATSPSNAPDAHRTLYRDGLRAQFAAGVTRRSTVAAGVCRHNLVPWGCDDRHRPHITSP